MTEDLFYYMLEEIVLFLFCIELNAYGDKT